jgi:hypothetical protein
VIDKPNKIQPALMGGLVIGLLWSIPFLSLANMCCCLGVMVGGALAAWMLIKRSPVLPISYGDGAVVGLLAGVVGAGVHLVLGVPIQLAFNGAGLGMIRSLFSQMGNPEAQRMIEEAIRNSQNQPLTDRLFGALFAWLIVSVISIGFASIGGLIGVALFEKRKGQYPPPPPPLGYPPPGPSGASPYGEPPRGY